MSTLIAEWAAGNPTIKRAWLFAGPGEDAARPDGPIDVALELQPVADSEETGAAWMGNCEKWRLQLQARTGRGVELEWLDPDEGARTTRAGETRMLVYDRAG